MCGIFGVLNNNNLYGSNHIRKYFMKGQSRGPEFSSLEDIEPITTFGFHRLAINGLNPASHQPLKYDNISLICNGGSITTYYAQILYKTIDRFRHEVIIHMYRKYGIEYTLNQLDPYSHALYDGKKLYLARDPYGVRPLFTLEPSHPNAGLLEAFASTMASLHGLTHVLNKNEKIKQFT